MPTVGSSSIIILGSWSKEIANDTLLDSPPLKCKLKTNFICILINICNQCNL